MTYKLKQNEIFVFGSNALGHHGATGAKDAYEHYGAVIGCSIGMQGSSYAIPTKDEDYVPHPIPTLKLYVDQFLEYSAAYPMMTFLLTKIGCGLAGFGEEVVATLFLNAPDNVILVDGETKPICKASHRLEDTKQEKWW